MFINFIYLSGEMHILNKNKDVYMANAQVLSNGDEATLIKSSNKNKWTETILEADNQKNCRLNLKENLVYIQEEPINSFSSSEIYPDIIMASGTKHIYLALFFLCHQQFFISNFYFKT